MDWPRAAVALGAAVVAGALLVSGGSAADPRTPAGLPGMPPPFLGVAVVGGGGLTGAIDAYGDVVDLRPQPAGRALIDNPSDREAAGTVPVDTGIVPWVSVGHRRPRPLWTADSVVQRYRPGTGVLVTTARFGAARVRIVYAAGRSLLACLTQTTTEAHVSMRISEPAAAGRLRCDDGAARRIVRAAERGDRRWLGSATQLGRNAPRWARSIYRRSLLVLHALTGGRTGAVAAGARDGWAYVWPRDTSAVALALGAAGYREEAQRVSRFLLGLDLAASARFYGNGEPVPGRGPEGDASGWVAVATHHAIGRSGGGLAEPSHQLSGETSPGSTPALPDYQEGEPGDYLGNSLATTAANNPRPAELHQIPGLKEPDFDAVRLVRVPGEPGSGLDSAAAWAVEPFSQPSLYGAARRTMLALVRRGGHFGITPGTAWAGEDPWSAPTAWTAWSLAALARDERGQRSRADRRAALRLLADLRRAATTADLLPERVDAQTGIPRSTTPLAWSHAFTILALRELWPPRRTPRTASNFSSRR